MAEGSWLQWQMVQYCKTGSNNIIQAQRECDHDASMLPIPLLLQLQELPAELTPLQEDDPGHPFAPVPRSQTVLSCSPLTCAGHPPQLC